MNGVLYYVVLLISYLLTKWQVAQFIKMVGGELGISLEGTVDVEDGVETKTHHYIRSILPEGLIGATGKLRSGDELLEVNDTVLLGKSDETFKL